MSKRRVIVLAAIAVVILAGGGIFGFKAIRDRVNAEKMCDLITAQRSTQGTVFQVTEGARKVAVLGDSYSAGYGIPSMADSWESALGEARGWTMNVAAVSTSGIINPGACGDSEFSGRVAAVKATNPDLLIVQDGLNDLGYPAADVERAAVDLLGEFAETRQVVVIGPSNVPGKKGLADVDAALRSAAARTGAQYVSALGWDLDFGPDGGHLSVEGHQQYAALVGEALATR